MRRFACVRSAGLLGLVVALSCAPIANAGNLDGPASAVAVIPPGQSLFMDVVFVAGEPAAVAIRGSGSGTVGLYMADGDGHFWWGNGFLDRKLIAIDVYRTGIFNVQVHNSGAVPNTVVLQTN